MKALQVNPHYKQLNAMKGKSFIYMGRTVHVEYWHEQDGNIIIVPESGREIIIAAEKLSDELGQFLPSEEGSNTMAVAMVPDTERMSTLEDALMNSIKDIQDEKPNAIAKAKQIANTSNTLLNLTNTKLKMLKEIRKS